MSKEERLDILEQLTQRLDRIIELMEVKRNIEPMTTFIPASNKASNEFINERQKEIFSSLDNKEVK